MAPYKCQTGRSDGRRVYSYDFKSLQWINGFEETSEISSEIAAEFGFFMSANNENDNKSRNMYLPKGEVAGVFTMWKTPTTLCKNPWWV